jgi:hypothetical protein
MVVETVVKLEKRKRESTRPAGGVPVEQLGFAGHATQGGQTVVSRPEAARQVARQRLLADQTG